jgi:hypothetical protein
MFNDGLSQARMLMISRFVIVHRVIMVMVQIIREYMFNDLSRIFVTQPAREKTTPAKRGHSTSDSESDSDNTSKPENPRGRLDPSSPLKQLGNGFRRLAKNLWQCNLCQKIFSGRPQVVENHLATWEHQKLFAYLPYHLVFMTDIVILVNAHIPNATPVFRP